MTVETGTRNAMPVNLPCSSGITRPTAFAAPVEAGTMFSDAALESLTRSTSILRKTLTRGENQSTLETLTAALYFEALAHQAKGDFDRALARAEESLAAMNQLREKAGIESFTVFFANRGHNGDRCDIYFLASGLRLASVPDGMESDPPINGANCSPKQRP